MNYEEIIDLDDTDAKILKKAYKFTGNELKDDAEYYKTCTGELIALVESLNDEVEYYKDMVDQQQDEIVELMKNGGKYEEIC